MVFIKRKKSNLNFENLRTRLHRRRDFFKISPVNSYKRQIDPECLPQPPLTNYSREHLVIRSELQRLLQQRSSTTLHACTLAYVPMEVDERTEDTTTRAIKTTAPIERTLQHLVLTSAIASCS
jgi:hypothetical protein